MNDTVLIKKEFENVKTLRIDIRKIFNEIEEKINVLKMIYLELINTHHENAYILGIDSFHFQNKMIENEYEFIGKVFVGIDNRMYCEYYKIYKMIQEYIKTEINDVQFISKYQSSSNKKFPVYKDLENSKNYEFNIIADLHETIIQTITDLGDFLSNKMSKLNEDTKHYKRGLYIDNMIHTINYSNAILIERINMFIRFMETFNKHHTKYFSRLLSKSKLMMDIINEDIKLKSSGDLSPPSTPEIIVENSLSLPSLSLPSLPTKEEDTKNISLTIMNAINTFSENNSTRIDIKN